MSKSQTLVWAVICGGVTVFCIAAGWILAGILALITATIFCLLWAAKYGRDQGIARKYRAEPIDDAPKHFPRTSPGSGRLYVP